MSSKQEDARDECVLMNTNTTVTIFCSSCNDSLSVSFQGLRSVSTEKVSEIAEMNGCFVSKGATPEDDFFVCEKCSKSSFSADFIESNKADAGYK